MPSDPLLARRSEIWPPRVPRAREILNGYFEDRQKLLDQPKDCRAEKQIIEKAQQQLFSDRTNSDDRLWNAVAFYHAQLDRFNCRVRDGKQDLVASRVEWQLGPTWQVCAQELCGLAASRGPHLLLEHTKPK